jgi:hypothetical protein
MPGGEIRVLQYSRPRAKRVKYCRKIVQIIRLPAGLDSFDWPQYELN